MSDYQEARQRLARAIAEREVARDALAKAGREADAADAEVEAATSDLLRFEIDPYARPRHLTGASA